MRQGWKDKHQGSLRAAQRRGQGTTWTAERYAFSYGLQRTSEAIRQWRENPAGVLRVWVPASVFITLILLLAVAVISELSSGYVLPSSPAPPLVVGGLGDVTHILFRNSLVLLFHALACVAGFIAGSSLPLQAQRKSGVSRWVHEHGGRLAILFVVGATIFSLSVQAYRLGRTLAGVAAYLHFSPLLLLVSVLPHAIPELVALFLPLAAWIMASRKGEWDTLLAATGVTVSLAIPVLVFAAFVEVYVSPHLFTSLTGLSTF